MKLYFWLLYFYGFVMFFTSEKWTFMQSLVWPFMVAQWVAKAGGAIQ